MDTPWVAKEYPADDAWHIHTPDGGWIASVHIDGEQDLAREQARLIAAAPDLLEALDQLAGNAEIARFMIVDEDGIVSSALWDTIQQARAAIAKATQP